MGELAEHFERVRNRHPRQTLVLAMDIDGTIVDMRHHIVDVLRRYDRAHSSAWFIAMKPADMEIHERSIDILVERAGVPTFHEAVRWIRNHFWDDDTVFAAQIPFPGVLEIVRWFQLQPDVLPVFITGRPERLRRRTLDLLRKLGAPHRLRIGDDQLYMAPDGCRDVPGFKVSTLRSLVRRGYCPFAFVDNEPENLAAAYLAGFGPDLCLLHADTIFDSSRALLPAGTASGDEFNLDQVTDPRRFPSRIEFVLRGADDVESFRRLLETNVAWMEVDPRTDSRTGEVVATDPDTPADGVGVTKVRLAEVVSEVKKYRKRLKLNLTEGRHTLRSTLESVADSGIDDSDVWFAGDLKTLNPLEFRLIRSRFPAATLQVSVDCVLEDSVSEREQRRMLDVVRCLGANRVAVDIRKHNFAAALERLEALGWKVDVTGVTSLAEFLVAVLAAPSSITADFRALGDRDADLATTIERAS